MFCPYCGSENSEDSKFCAGCGRQIIGDGGAAPDSPISGTGSSEHSGYAGPSPPRSHGFQSEPYGADLEGYQISVTRIYVMFILSFGVYYIYWMYRTWKQHRDHTGAIAYPVWHALTTFVPVYNFFRVHAHIKAYRRLMDDRGLTSNLEPGMVVGRVLGVLLVVLVQLILSFLVLVSSFSFEETQLFVQVAGDVIGLIAVVALAWIFATVQEGINSYWAVTDTSLAQTARIGKGEVLVVVIGLFIWAGTLLVYMELAL